MGLVQNPGSNQKAAPVLGFTWKHTCMSHYSSACMSACLNDKRSDVTSCLRRTLTIAHQHSTEAHHEWPTQLPKSREQRGACAFACTRSRHRQDRLSCHRHGSPTANWLTGGLERHQLNMKCITTKPENTHQH